MARDPKETPPTKLRNSDAAAEQQAQSRRKNRGGGAVADWSSCDGGRLRTALCNVSAKGFALMLGYTRDQGSYTIRVVGAPGEDADYIRATEDIDYYLECLALDYE